MEDRNEECYNVCDKNIEDIHWYEKKHQPKSLTKCIMKAIFFFFFWVLGLELRIFTLSHSIRPIFVKDFQDRVSLTVFPDWLQTTICLISAS
jgi:hypothetical protein